MKGKKEFAISIEKYTVICQDDALQTAVRNSTVYLADPHGTCHFSNNTY